MALLRKRAVKPAEAAKATAPEPPKPDPAKIAAEALGKVEGLATYLENLDKMGADAAALDGAVKELKGWTEKAAPVAQAAEELKSVIEPLNTNLAVLEKESKSVGDACKALSVALKALKDGPAEKTLADAKAAIKAYERYLEFVPKVESPELVEEQKVIAQRLTELKGQQRP